MKLIKLKLRLIVPTVLTLLSLAAPKSGAQTAIITGTVIDPNGNPYANGTASAFKVVATGQNPGTPVNVATTVGGSFSMSVPSPAAYQFTICAPPVNIGPKVNPTPTQVCFSSGPISITGNADISSSLPVAPLLGPGGTNAVQPAIAGDGVVILNSLGKLGDFGQPPVGISSASASDNFNRADQNPIASPWIAAGAFPLPRLFNNTMTVASTVIQSDIALYSGIAWPNDQFIQTSITQLRATTGYIAWVLRCDAPGNNFYYVDIDASPGFGGIGLLSPLNLQKIVGGVLQGPPYHILGNVTPQIGDVFKVQVVGSTISVFQNGLLVGTFTDTTSPITSGSGGIFLQSASGISSVSDVAVDNWVGGGVGTGGVIAGHLVSFSPLPNQIADSGIVGTPGASVATMYSCGVTATCSRALQTGLIFVTGGAINLIAGTITITNLPFTSSTSYVCTASNSTNNDSFTIGYVSGSVATFAAGAGTDTIRYMCMGN